MRVHRPIRVLMVAVVLVLAASFCGVELLYRWGLARVGPLPRLPSEPHVGRVQRALWAAEEGGPMQVQRQWPRRARWVLDRLLASGELTQAEHAESLRQLQALTGP